MGRLRLAIAVARPQDAETWLMLRYLARGQSLPGDIAGEVAHFRSTPVELADKRFIVWLGDAPIGSFELFLLDNVVEIRHLSVASHYLDTYGPAIMRKVVSLAGERGSVLTAEYQEAYSAMFVGAGFRQNRRTKMKTPLSSYRGQAISLPAGVSLRHPRFEDEAAVGEMAYKNYEGTFDRDMVSSSKAQAAAMISAMFNSEYATFRTDCSYLAEDEQKRPVGNCLLGDVSKDEGEKLVWVLDISVGEQWRGKGLGKALLGSALNAAKAAGFASAGLIVTIGNDNAYRLYRSYGFEEYGGLMYEGVLKVEG